MCYAFMNNWNYLNADENNKIIFEFFCVYLQIKSDI